MPKCERLCWLWNLDLIIGLDEKSLVLASINKYGQNIILCTNGAHLSKCMADIKKNSLRICFYCSININEIFFRKRKHDLAWDIFKEEDSSDVWLTMIHVGINSEPSIFYENRETLQVFGKGFQVVIYCNWKLRKVE